jgi:hypothetical protein
MYINPHESIGQSSDCPSVTPTELVGNLPPKYLVGPSSNVDILIYVLVSLVLYCALKLAVLLLVSFLVPRPSLSP